MSDTELDMRIIANGRKQFEDAQREKERLHRNLREARENMDRAMANSRKALRNIKIAAVLMGIAVAFQITALVVTLVKR